MTDPHKVLGVGRSADLADIRSAYKNLAKKLHPDKIGSNHRALEQMKLVNDAYASLCTDLQRRRTKEEGKDGSVSTDEIWISYSKQVEDYYAQVQMYMEEQQENIKMELERLSTIKKELDRREEAIKIRERELGRTPQPPSGQNVDMLLRRESYMAGLEDRLDELLLHVSRSNSLLVDLSQGSKSLRNREKGARRK